MGIICKTRLRQVHASQQSVHLTLGILRTSQAVSYAVTFFWLDGVPPPAPARVTQTVGRQVNVYAYAFYASLKQAVGIHLGNLGAVLDPISDQGT